MDNKKIRDIDPKYDLYSNEIDTIYRTSPGAFEMIARSFELGYSRGQAATIAKMKGGVVA